jgi:nonribosomal peptide synthetase DhbF
MYRTGDIGRRGTDGNIHFLGRGDRQVKIRGFRVEFGEIEAALKQCASIRECLVGSSQDEESNARLVAYVVPDTGSRIVPPDLIEQLKEVLPEYMVPSSVVVLEDFPLTPHGKVDSNALPTADSQRSPVVVKRPKSPEEEILCALFARVLGVSFVDIEANFFSLGGHSLLAIRLVSLIRKELGIEVTIRTLFEAPSVALLIRSLKNQFASTKGMFEPVLPMRRTGSLRPLFCLPPAYGLGWGYAGLLNELSSERPLYCLQAPMIGHKQPLTRSIEEAAMEYIDLIKQIQPSGPYHLLGWSFGGKVSHTMACQLQREGEQVAFLAILDTYPASLKAPVEEQAMDNDFLEVKRMTAMFRLCGATESDVDRIFRVGAQSAVLATNFRPGLYHGNVLLFAAAEAMEHRLWTSWAPYVSGEICMHELTCKHSEIIQPKPLTMIAAIVEKHILDHSNFTS